LLHFYSEGVKEDEFGHFVEVVDSDGGFIGVQKLDLPLDTPSGHNFMVLESTWDDMIYTADDISGYPVVRAYKVSYSKK